MHRNFNKASFRDFENIPGLNPWERAVEFKGYLEYLEGKGHLNYRMKVVENLGPEVVLERNGFENRRYVSLVSNDYLGLSRHPKVIEAAVAGLREFGTGTGASPAIGGHFEFHALLEKKIAGFFGKTDAICYTTGYTANSATLQCLLKKEDLAILDMAVHASVYEGCQLTNVKRFLHNDMEDLERILKQSKDHYRTRLVVVDGVYSQDGDIAKLKEIIALAKHYGAFVMIDDAHGVGVLGEAGRGVVELLDVLDDVDIISGTFSKTFGHLGGYVIASAELIRFLKFQSRQHLFSVTSTPASACILKSIDLIDEEPLWREQLLDNAAYLKAGLKGLGFDIGSTVSAIIPVKIGDPEHTREVGRLLLEAGVYANPITYPAVALKDARVRMSVLATHTQEHLDMVLNAYAYVRSKLKTNRKWEGDEIKNKLLQN